jgi:hypothetical protein
MLVGATPAIVEKQDFEGFENVRRGVRARCRWAISVAACCRILLWEVVVAGARAMCSRALWIGFSGVALGPQLAVLRAVLKRRYDSPGRGNEDVGRGARASDETLVGVRAVEVGAPDRRSGARETAEIGPIDVRAVHGDAGWILGAGDEALVCAGPIEVGPADCRTGSAGSLVCPVDVAALDCHAGWSTRTAYEVLVHRGAVELSPPNRGTTRATVCAVVGPVDVLAVDRETPWTGGASDEAVVYVCAVQASSPVVSWRRLSQ